MSKKQKIALSILLVVIIVSIGGYYYWKIKIKKPVAQQATEDVQKTAADISANVGNNVTPDVTTPAVNLPNTDANPYSKTNPFSNLKTNPFQ